MAKFNYNKVRKRQAAEAIKAEKEAITKQVIDDLFILMLGIPINVLIADYWPKTAEKKLPGFIDECLNMFEAWQDGVITTEDMREMVEKYGGIKVGKTVQ